MSNEEPSLVDVLEAIRVSHEKAKEAEILSRGLNPEVVLAALDDMLQPWTLHEKAQLHVVLRNIKKLRSHVAQYVEE